MASRSTVKRLGAAILGDWATGTTLTDEYTLVRDAFGFDDDTLAGIATNATVSFGFNGSSTGSNPVPTAFTAWTRNV